MMAILNRGQNGVALGKAKEVIRREGLTAHISEGKIKTTIGVVGDIRTDLRERLRSQLRAISGIEDVVDITVAWKLASREFHPDDTIIPVAGGMLIGGYPPVVMAGPCSEEGNDRSLRIGEGMLQILKELKLESMRLIFRAGAYKPRTSPYSSQGMMEEGLRNLERVRQKLGLPFITEVMYADTVEAVSESADIVQVGTRNAQNFDLLKLVGRVNKPVFLKRGMSQTMKEWLMSAEYVLSSGNPHVMLCERGIRTFEPWTRNTLDLSAVPVIRKETHLPIIVDPSHGTGRRDCVISMALAALMAGAHGIMVEVHDEPEKAFSDGHQSLTLEGFRELMTHIAQILPVIQGIYHHQFSVQPQAA